MTSLHVGIVRINLRKRKQLTRFLSKEEPDPWGIMYAKAIRNL